MKTCCSGQASFGSIQEKIMPPAMPTGPWVTGIHQASTGPIPLIGTHLGLEDTMDRWKARWGIRRDALQVQPGLYAVGTPGKEAIVLATANYKPSFDALRKELGGLDAWVLVLDTKGVNVWCAAGKGTFGTDELARRIVAARLKDVVSHKTIIVPQLAAPGIASHSIKAMTGFKVVFGPVRAHDIKPFLENNMQATSAMRTVRFDLWDRVAVVPIELVMVMKYFLILLCVVAVWKWFAGNLTLENMVSSTLPLLGALLLGTVGVPVLLPWIPPRSFALKGLGLGLLWTFAIGLYQGWGMIPFLGNLLLLPAVSAFLALNFTGASTFTSQTGVNREIGLFARPMAALGVCGILLLGVNILIGALK
jgi:hypothetical protein